MAFNYYRHNPGWGTQQFQLGAPPLPGYQPQPSWTGQDFYSAHAMGADPYLYQNTMSRLSSLSGGVGKYEAKQWHRRAYAGLGEVTRMGPQEIGFAAAYEAHRQIKYGANVYNNLYTDYERQREALRALAIAEAARLWQDTGHGYDQYGLQTACDAAAATAGHISSEREMEDSQGYGGQGYGGQGYGGLGVGSFRDRRNSIGALSAGGYAGSGYGGGSVYGGGSPLQMARSIPGSPIMGASSIPIPGSPYLGGGYAGSVGGPASYGGGYPGSYSSPGYDQFGLPGSFGGGYLSAPGTPAPGAIVIHQQPESHHHRHRSHRSHRHHHHRRHRSHDRY